MYRVCVYRYAVRYALMYLSVLLNLYQSNPVPGTGLSSLCIPGKKVALTCGNVDQKRLVFTGYRVPNTITERVIQRNTVRVSDTERN